jgi:hypothetical protein
VGSPEFARNLAGMRDFKSFLDQIREAPVEVDQWQLEKLALTGQKFELFFFTPGITSSQLGFLGNWAYKNLDEAVAAVLKGLPVGARVALLPDGPYTFARADSPCPPVSVEWRARWLFLKEKATRHPAFALHQLEKCSSSAKPKPPKIPRSQFPLVSRVNFP